MSVTSFDTLTYAKLLQEAGFTAQQAEAQAEALRAVVDQNLATKQDLKEMETRLDHKIELVRRDIIIWLGGIVVAGFAVMASMTGVVIALVAL